MPHVGVNSCEGEHRQSRSLRSTRNRESARTKSRPTGGFRRQISKFPGILVRKESLAEGLQFVKLSVHTPLFCQVFGVIKTQLAQILRFFTDDKRHFRIKLAEKSKVKMKVLGFIFACWNRVDGRKSYAIVQKNAAAEHIESPISSQGLQ